VSLSAVTAGAVAALKVKWSADEVAEVPAVVVTVTSMVPAACDGATAVICVAESTVKEAATVPKRTLVAAVKLVPVRTTLVPPAVEPVEVPSAVAAGGEAALKV